MGGRPPHTDVVQRAPGPDVGGGEVSEPVPLRGCLCRAAASLYNVWVPTTSTSSVAPGQRRVTLPAHFLEWPWIIKERKDLVRKNDRIYLSFKDVRFWQLGCSGGKAPLHATPTPSQTALVHTPLAVCRNTRGTVAASKDAVTARPLKQTG